MGLQPFTQYRVGVRIKNQEEFGEVGRTVEMRTLSAAPNSPPLNLTVRAVTAGAALASWQPPATPNGHIYKYVLELSYQDSLGRRIGAQRFQVNTTEASLENLLSYTKQVSFLSTKNFSVIYGRLTFYKCAVPGKQQKNEVKNTSSLITFFQ